LPFLRFNRDKRGYENTFVVQTERRRRGQQRILYWFRTPPGVKVGRAPLDEDAIRLIEEHNPDLDFDWTRILKGHGRESDTEPAAQAGPNESSRTAAAQAPDPGMPDRSPVPTSEVAEPEAVPDVSAQLDETPVSAAERKLGVEGLARLRGRYAEMLARISDRIADQDRQVELKTIAERLNPDAWVTDSDVLSGLDSYEATFESLRGIVGHGRRHTRRGRRRKEGRRSADRENA
jgi:hypothetical protein